MNRKFKVFIMAFTAFCLAGCHDKTESEPTGIRLANFMVGADNITITITDGDGGQHQSKLAFGEAGNYIKLPEGKARIDIKDNERSVLTHSIGIGKGSHFTLAVRGIDGDEATKKEMTLHARLLDIFEGATGNPANGGLPLLNVYCDRFEGAPDQGQLRVSHLAPFMDKLEVYIDKGDGLKSIEKLSYPAVSSRLMAYNPGSYKLQIRPSGSPLILYEGEIEIRASELSTLFIIPKPGTYPDNLQVKVLKTNGSGTNS